jgi:predicted transcriptional regulator
MSDTTTYPAEKPVEKPIDKVALRERMRLKIDEMFSKDDKADPIVVERINQIINDAVASMPEAPKEPSTEKPEDGMTRRLKERVETLKANSDVKPELAEKLDEIAAAVEAALSEIRADDPAPIKAVA